MSGIRYFSEVLNQKGAPALYEDTIDNIPAATFEGRLFFATDVVSGDTIFRDNGDGTWSALAGNAGGGGPFINGVTDLTGGVGLGGSLDQNTEILLNGLSFKLTNNGDNFLIDTVNDLYYFGKGGALDVGCGIHITENSIYTQYLTNEIGLQLDFANQIYQFGDFNNNNTGTFLKINDNNLSIRTYFGNNEIGLSLNYDNSFYWLGDYNAINNNTHIFVDEGNAIVLLFGGSNNNTNIQIEDNVARINFESNTGSYNFANVPNYANNATAILAGLSVGDIYRVTGTGNMHIVF
jgi:hypothetical protein